MKKFLIILALLLTFALVISVWYFANSSSEMRFSDVEAEFEDPDLVEETPATDITSVSPEPSVSPISQLFGESRSSRWASYWKEFSPAEKAQYGNVKRLAGPLHVGIQVGHWKNDEVPTELANLKRSGGGAVGGGKTEVNTVLEIARRVKIILEKEGVVVDLLPTTLPVDYLADAFVSIHADGNPNPDVSGFKIASPQRDFSGKSVALVDALYKSYEDETGLDTDSNITRRMSGYFAFNWRRYEHALHPITPAAIVETGFMTSPEDRSVIVSNPERAARGIAEGILEFLK